MNEVVIQTARPDNADRAFIQSLVETGAQEVELAMNPALAALKAVLIDAVPGTLSVRFTAPETSLQGNGVVSGGTLTSMLDFAMALALLSKLPVGRTCATITLTVNMLEAGHIGNFIARAKVDRLGGRIAFLSAELFDADGKRRVAHATASFAVFDVRS
ncbi:Medium/long-chain acyl-CoA thioesterase YigI [Paraburkholderia tropica]